MSLRSITMITLAVVAVGAQAAPLTTLPSSLPSIGGSGLENVLFNVATSADGLLSVALGAHAYKNDAYLANNGTDTFYAGSGVYLPDGLNRANWSFDFSYRLAPGCVGCSVLLRIDTDPSAATNFVDVNLTSAGYGLAGGDSWNLKMGFLSPIGFDPFSPSTTDFALVVRNGAGRDFVGTNITVSVPEPATLTLLGLGLAGLGFMRRKQA